MTQRVNLWTITARCERCSEPSTWTVEYERGVSVALVCEDVRADGCPRCGSWAMTVVVADRVREVRS